MGCRNSMVCLPSVTLEIVLLFPFSKKNTKLTFVKGTCHVTSGFIVDSNIFRSTSTNLECCRVLVAESRQKRTVVSVHGLVSYISSFFRESGLAILNNFIKIKEK